MLIAQAVIFPPPGLGIRLFSRQPPQQLPAVALGLRQAAACVVFLTILWGAKAAEGVGGLGAALDAAQEVIGSDSSDHTRVILAKGLRLSSIPTLPSTSGSL